MSRNSFEDLGKLILRLSLGVLLALHGIAKLRHGTGSIESMMLSHGFPAFFAWGVYIGEILAPLLVILGFYTRLGALLIAVNMGVAIALAHSTQLFDITSNGGWRLELQGLYLFVSLAIMMLGAGRYSLAGSGGRWN